MSKRRGLNAARRRRRQILLGAIDCWSAGVQASIPPNRGVEAPSRGVRRRRPRCAALATQSSFLLEFYGQ